MTNEERDLTKEEVEELKKALVYAKTTPGTQPKDTSLDDHIRWSYCADKNIARIFFIVGVVINLIVFTILTIIGFVDQIYPLAWIGLVLILLAIVGTIVRFFPTKNDADNLLKGERRTKAVVGTLIALHITPIGLWALLSYVVATDNEFSLEDIKKRSFYRVCHNAKEFKDLLEVLADDYQKGNIEEAEYNKTVSDLKVDLERYIASLEDNVKSVEGRIQKGLATKKDLEKTKAFNEEEKEIALEILNPALAEEKRKEALRKEEELKEKLPTLILEMEAKVDTLDLNDQKSFNTYKSHYESGIFTIEEYYKKLKELLNC